MAQLFPRLTATDAALLWESLQGSNLQELKKLSATSHPSQYFAALGGQRVEQQDLERLKTEVEDVARAHGYPDKASRSSAANFDTDLAIFLATRLDISDGEAYRNETWAFISLVLLPHVVKWRFPDFHPSRCTGGRRDCMQRLWLRSRLFDLGEKAGNRWIILKSLTEDAFVSIVERPSLAGNPEICKTLGLTWLKTSAELGKSRMEAINRSALKRFRAKGTLTFLDSLDYKTLKLIAEDCYHVASLETGSN
ncbi:hypothetical protein N9H37_03300 [Congregibacter sp.]|nr:hypothetical protein [Congregibacter sp.]MDA8962360.1 hypothetical protein [Congregibacter sp.]